MKKIKSSDKARQSLFSGITDLAETVATTLGPKGRIVVLDNGVGHPPTATKDGVTVAKRISFEDPYKNQGATLVKMVASQADNGTGDGTTTASILAQAITQEGLKALVAGANPMDVKRGIDKAVGCVVDTLKDMSVPLDKDKLREVAYVSANNDEVIGNMIADAKEKLGEHGIINLNRTQFVEDSLDLQLGLGIDRGYVSGNFVNDQVSMQCQLKEPAILLYDGTLEFIKDCGPFFEKSSQLGKPIFIMCNEAKGEALSTMIMNHMKGDYTNCIINMPGFGNESKELLKDVAAVTGATVVTETLGMLLKDCDVDVLGSAENIIISQHKTVVTNGAGKKEDIESRINNISDRLEAKKDPEAMEGWLKERRSRLEGGVAVIKVGGRTSAEIGERHDRYIDAVSAVNSAEEEGILPGGGVALVRAIANLDLGDLEGDEALGGQAILRACSYPLKRIAENSGMNGDVVLNKVLEGSEGYGYNAKTNTYEDLFEVGIVDPLKVTRVALQSAASIAGIVLTTEAIVPKN